MKELNKNVCETISIKVVMRKHKELMKELTEKNKISIMDGKYNEILNFCKMHSGSKNLKIYEAAKSMLSKYELQPNDYDVIITEILKILNL